MMQSLLVPTTYLLGLTKDKAYARIKDILKSVSLPLETLNKYPHELSGGQAQRIAIARSLLSKSPLIVLDLACVCSGCNYSRANTSIIKKFEKRV